MTTPVILLVGEHLREGRSLALEAASQHVSEGRQAVIIEGGPGTLLAPAGVELVQLAPGCICCMGQLPLRVTVARLLRQVKPVSLWIEVSMRDHLPALRQQLQGPGFAGALVLLEGKGGRRALKSLAP